MLSTNKVMIQLLFVGAGILLSFQALASDYQLRLAYQCIDARATAERVLAEDKELAREQRQRKSIFETAEREIRDLERELDRRERRANSCDRSYSPQMCQHHDNEARLARDKLNDVIDISNRHVRELNRINDRVNELNAILTRANAQGDEKCPEASRANIPNRIYQQACRNVDFISGSSLLEQLREVNLCN